jgi:hypothetical protein
MIYLFETHLILLFRVEFTTQNRNKTFFIELKIFFPKYNILNRMMNTIFISLLLENRHKITSIGVIFNEIIKA